MRARCAIGAIATHLALLLQTLLLRESALTATATAATALWFPTASHDFCASNNGDTPRRVVDGVDVGVMRARCDASSASRATSYRASSRVRARRTTTMSRAVWILMSAAWLFATSTRAMDDAAAVEPYAYPRALVGSFKGEWWLDASSVDAAEAFTRDGWRRGTCALTLRSSFDARTSVQSLIGEILFREGEYIGRGDVGVPLEGVYASTTGAAYAHGATRTTKEVLSATNESAWSWTTWQGASAYRESLRAVASDVLGEGAVRASTTMYRARDSFSRTAAVNRAGPAARSKFIATHDAGEYPAMCQFKLHAYVTPGAYGNATSIAPAVRGNDDLDNVDEIGGDILDRQVEDMRPMAFVDMAKPASLIGKFVSDNCGLTVHVTLESQRLETWYKKARSYAYMMMAVAVAQGYVLLQQLDASGTQASLLRLSLASIGLRSVVDSYFCLAHLTGGILVDDLFMPLALVSMCYFILFSVLEMRLLIAAWRARRPELQNWLELRINLGAIYSRFYAAFISGLFLMYWLSDKFFVFIVLTNSYWLPQIVRNAYHNHRQVLKPSYVIVTSFTRLIGPLYVLGCPSNFLKIKPNYVQCAILIAWTSAQAATLLAQHFINPRYGFPDGLFPEVYDYHRKVPEEVLAQCGVPDEETERAVTRFHETDVEMGDIAAGPDCVICMNPVQCRDVNERMVTPCNHFFHTKCLVRWMDIKQECPTCRRNLPPM